MRPRSFDPGRLKTLAALQQAAATDDGAGGLDLEWADLAMVPILLEPLGAAAARHGGQDLETATHKATFRHRGDVRSGMRFVVDTRLLVIRTVAERDSDGRYMVALVEEEGR